MIKFKKILAIVMATMFVLAMGMIYASAAMEVVFYRAQKNGTYNTASFTMTTDYYPATTNAQVTSTIECSSGHTVSSTSYGMIAFNNDPDEGFLQTSNVISPSTSYISYAIKDMSDYDMNEVYYFEGHHNFKYDGVEIPFYSNQNITVLYNNGNF